MRQITDTIFMVRPIQFRLNEETAVNNYYQDEGVKIIDQNKKAQDEFDAFAKALQDKGINVLIVQDRIEFDTPDSIFPNNWISTHENGDVALYPMFAENRRRERRPDAMELMEAEGFQI
ncbi:MAG: arginine deiminase-related protein, partial [Nonlabens sp.]